MNQNTESFLLRTVVKTHEMVERMERELSGVKHGLSILTREVEIMKRRPVTIRMTLGTPVPQRRLHKLLRTHNRMNFPLGDTQKVPFTLTVTDADGNAVQLQDGESISVVSSDEESLTVVMDSPAVAGSAASGFLLGGKKLATGVTATATLTKADGSTITGVDTLDIVAGAASALAFGLGAPVAQ